jgi:hypothetical protein
MKMLKSKRALSTVVTTLIILVVSVLLATVVTFYAINVTTTRVQEEYLQITNLHVWRAENTTPGVAAFVITNTGGRDVVIDKITVRGVPASGEYIYYKKIGDVIDPPANVSAPGGYTQLGSDSLILPSGSRICVYIFNLDHISTSDIGVTVSVTVFTANAQYHKETNIEAMP